MEDLKLLTAARGAIKAKLTVFKKFVEAADADTDDLAFEKRVKANENLYDRFDNIQSKIEVIVVGTELESTHLQERESFETTYFGVISSAEKRVNSVRSSQSPVDNVVPGSSDAHHAPPLPVIKLPSFDGNYGQWIRFRDTFTSLVHDSERLTDIDRFNYLTSVLTGQAARIIESFSISAANYKLAWSRLKERFEDPKALVDHHIDALLATSPLHKPDGKALCEFFDSAVNNTRALESLLTPAELSDALLTAYLSKRLDSVSLDEWEKHVMGFTKRPTFRDFSKFLEQRAQYLERKQTAKSSTSTAPASTTIANMNRRLEQPRSKKNKGSYVATSHITSRSNKCPLCESEHTLQNCSQLLAMAFPDRHETIKRLQVCFNCLLPGHSIKSCTRGKCRTCGKKHHTILHRENATAPSAEISKSEEPSTSHVVQACISNSAATEYTVLSTALVYVIDGKGNKHECRALLDVGSQAHFATSEFCEKLALPRTAIDITVGGLGKGINPIRSKAQLRITSACKTFAADLACLIIDNITEQMPNIPLARMNVPIPPGVTPADPNFQHPGRIDLLIGAGLFWKLLCVGQHKVTPGNLVWQKTRLGWVLGGSTHWPDTRKNAVQTCHIVTNAQLQNSISRFWETEEIRSGTNDRSALTDECERRFTETVTRDQTGRYVVAIPFNERVHQLGESRGQAERRFLNIERKFKVDPNLRAQYTDFMREYLNLGHMSLVDTSSVLDRGYYLPHHAVFKGSSTTTKIRVVFDGSARTTSGISLNDTQLVGPTVQSDLFSILVRFRKHRIVVSADVEKMYRQVWVRKTDRDYQRILWRFSEDEPIRVYNLNTVTYGTASASFLATRALQQVGKSHTQTFPHASKVILEDFYVDDLLTGCEGIEEAIQLRDAVTSILGQAGFPLRKWASNDPRITIHDRGDSYRQIEFKEADKDPKTLGLLWNTKSDSLSYTIKNSQTHRITKRRILSEIAQIFDPLGLVAPIIVKAKLIMQTLWQNSVDWDESLPQDIHTRWCNFRNDLDHIVSLAIPRRVLDEFPQYLELHGFSDASERAYGAAVYLRSRTNKGAWVSRLLCAKSRVAPLKTISLPRLELCGALLLAQLADKAKTALAISDIHEHYWSDSTIALSWIRDQPSRWKTFVANRVAEVQRLTDSDHWFHVSSADNPADLVSRGADLSVLKNDSLWWYGPPWLSQSTRDCPSSEPIATETIEERRTVAAHVTASIEHSSFYDRLVSRYSSYTKLLRIAAYCLRFTTNSRVKDPARSVQSHSRRFPPSATEIKQAEKTIVKMAQQEHFGEHIERIRAHKPLNKHSPLASLNPFLDEEGILRVGGRLANAPLDFDHKHPIILPKSKVLTTLIIRHEYLRLLHAGSQQTLASLHNRFWLISGKQLVRGVLRRCIACFRTNPVSPQYKMSNLPASRVTPARAFATCGIDYAGPFLIRDAGRARTVRKGYICLFICFVTKAIHIELATDLSTDAFLGCLQRFISRRGRCQSIHSDNGRNFIGARNELRELGLLLNSPDHNERIIEAVAKEGIEWHLIPPNAPNFGGLWERGIRSAKTYLKRVIGEQRLTFEELYTILTQVEACLNSRPLHPLSSDPKDLTPLTPGHFLIGDALTALPQPDLTNLSQNRLNRFQLIQQTFQHFWKRWNQEYLHGLQQRNKWKSDIPTAVKLDTMVLVKDNNLPPLHWRLGRIIDLHPGPDGITRVVSIRTADGVFKRPLTKICILPNADEPEDAPSS